MYNTQKNKKNCTCLSRNTEYQVTRRKNPMPLCPLSRPPPTTARHPIILHTPFFQATNQIANAQSASTRRHCSTFARRRRATLARTRQTLLCIRNAKLKPLCGNQVRCTPAVKISRRTRTPQGSRVQRALCTGTY